METPSKKIAKVAQQGPPSETSNAAKDLYPLHARLGFSTTILAGPTYLKEGIDFYQENQVQLKNEILSGFTVAIAQVPESVAFSFVAKVNPLVGLYATFFLGLITGLIGGRPGMVSGAAGAMAVVAVQIMSEDGLFTEKLLLNRGDISLTDDMPLRTQAAVR